MNRPRFRLASKIPEIRIPNERRSPIEIALERFRTTVDWADTHDGRAIIKVLQPKADKSRRTRQVLVTRKIDTPQAFALPKEASPQAIKAELHDELEMLCKLIVRARDLDSEGWGNCNTCGHRSNRLQWCHFIARADSRYLIYTPENTAYGCGRCNGPGQGMYREFRAWIEARTPGLAASLEAEAVRFNNWTWSIANLEDKKKELKAHLAEVHSGRAA